MGDLLGSRREDVRIGDIPLDPKDGDYWKVLTRDGSRALNVLDYPEDRRWWGDDPRHDQNLTGGVWGVWTPGGLYGVLSIHTVREHEDGTISVVPGDGSSNSILVSWDGVDDKGNALQKSYHGYIYNGVWKEC